MTLETQLTCRMDFEAKYFEDALIVLIIVIVARCWILEKFGVRKQQHWRSRRSKVRAFQKVAAGKRDVAIVHFLTRRAKKLDRLEFHHIREAEGQHVVLGALVARTFAVHARLVFLEQHVASELKPFTRSEEASITPLRTEISRPPVPVSSL